MATHNTYSAVPTTSDFTHTHGVINKLVKQLLLDKLLLGLAILDVTGQVAPLASLLFCYSLSQLGVIITKLMASISGKSALGYTVGY